MSGTVLGSRNTIVRRKKRLLCFREGRGRQINKKTTQEGSQRIRGSKDKHKGGQAGAVTVNKMSRGGCTEVTAELLAKGN